MTSFDSRRAATLAQLVLAMVAIGLSATPWFRGFPVGELVPGLVAASVVAISVPTIIGRVLRRSVLWSVAASLLLFVVAALLLVLREPMGFAHLLEGFRAGP